MKIIKLIDGKEYVIHDAEADYVKNLLGSDKIRFIPLSNGEIINIVSISRIGEPDTIAYWSEYPLSDSGLGFMRDGEYIALEQQNFAEIEHRPAPKYQTMPIVTIIKKLR